MINANELRIGNWVKFKHLLGFIITIKQDNCEIQSDRIIVNSSYDDIIPIPLTPEILEKCGFALNHVDQLAIVLNSMDRHLELNAEVNGNYFFSINQMGEFGDSSNVTLNYIQHLHQLQNLYWCLCGKELEINLQ